MTEPTPTAEDYGSIDLAVRELQARGWQRPFAPNEAVAAWASFVAAVEEGYDWSIDEYTNDMSVRRWAEEALPFLTPLIADSLGSRLNPLDERFRAATVDVGKLPGAGRDYWWETRLPRVLVGELAEDAERMNLRPDADT